MISTKKNQHSENLDYFGAKSESQKLLDDTHIQFFLISSSEGQKKKKKKIQLISDYESNKT